MPIAAREALHVGTRVSYEDAANPRREGRIAEVIQTGGTTPSGFALPTGDEYRVVFDDGSETISDLRQYGWHQLADFGEGNPFDGAEIIAAYTRERAIDDGELVAVGKEAQEAGFRWPVALTRALWNVVEPNEKERTNAGQSVEGRLWDVCFMGYIAIKRAPEGGTRIDYDVIFYEADRGIRAGQKTRRLRLETGPGDAGEPVVTIGFPEDF